MRPPLNHISFMFVAYLKFKNSHKALAITLLIVGTLVLSVVNIELYQYNTEVAEMLVDITPEDVLVELENETFKTLSNLPNVVLTPHIAGWSQQSFELMADVLLDKMNDFFN